MTTSERGCPHLHIVEKRPRMRLDAIQESLFPSAKRWQLFFVSLPGINDKTFRSIISATQPTIVVDLRRAARFNIGQLNRREALECFAANNSRYFDGMAISDAWATEDGAPNVSALFDAIHQAVPNLLSTTEGGPVLFLMAPTDEHMQLVTSIASEWRRCTRHDWEICGMF